MIEAVSNIAYTAILDMIFSKQIMPGTPLVETALASRLGISRTPIRDALKRLQRNGLVEIIPNSCTKVVSFSSEQIRQIGLVRTNLEELSVRLAIRNASDEELATLSEICKKYRDAINSGNMEQKIRIDRDFHMQISYFSRNDLLIKFQKELCLQVSFIQTHSDYDSADKFRSAQMHEDITKALQARDLYEAIKCVRHHLETFYDLDDTLTNII